MLFRYTFVSMGQIVTYRCGACDSSFLWMSGSGTFTKMAHCGTCGAAHAWPLHGGRRQKKVTKTKKCSCGGNVRLDAKVRCPSCKATDVIAGSDSAQWE